MTHGAHSHPEDQRNRDVLVDLNGTLVPRDEARVSVLDSGFLLGDGIWEGLRLERGRLAFLDRHLDRLFEGARALDLDLGLGRVDLARRLERCLDANGMQDGVHIRLMVTRGIKSTPFQDPRATVGEPTIVILAEYKRPGPELYTRGLTLATVPVRRGRPDVQDPSLNTHSKHNCIAACIAAARAGADEGLMLDPQGFVATCNSTHFFLVRGDELWTSTGDYCLDGITRRVVLELGEAIGMRVREKNFSLAKVYSADEVFVTGTFAGIVPVGSVDGREFDGPYPAPWTARLRTALGERIEREPTVAEAIRLLEESASA
ncbi:MAG TPA: aminotransferase class IV [Planctomycetes bacterium]|nr:aminotransferase class IV [Planctomycetota bacterium]